MRKFLSMTVFCLLVWAAGGQDGVGAPAPPADDRQYRLLAESFDQYLAAVNQLGLTPGLAVTAVDASGVVVRREIGWADAGQGQEMTSLTLFPLLDIGRGFLVAGAGLAVADGRLNWDERMVRLWPQFAVADDYSRTELRFDDLLSDRSGLPAMAGADLIELGWDSRHALASLALIDSSDLPRFNYARQTVAWLAAVRGLERAVGGSWPLYCQRRLLEPLEMRTTAADLRELAGLSGWAAGEMIVNGKPARQPLTSETFRQLAELGPSGSMAGTIVDLGKWLSWQILLTAGRDQPAGRPAVSLPMSVVKTMRQPMIEVSHDRQQGAIYAAKGWLVNFRTPHTEYFIPADGYGFSHMISFMPQGKVGVAVLSNFGPSPLPRQVVDTFYRLYFIRPEPQGDEDEQQARSRQSREIVGQAVAAARRLAGQIQAEIERVAAGTVVPFSDLRWLGTYTNPVYGRLRVFSTGSGLAAELGPRGVPLAIGVDDGGVAAYNLEPGSQPPGFFSRLEAVTDQHGRVVAICVRRYAGEGKRASVFERAE
ncbi:MAG: beta-lactamase family protein [Negativicutes bacterium]|nr:beta-lactamase family protein [Negativicutes bacterium]